VLLVLYSVEVSHVRQAVSPSSANWYGMQREHTMSEVALQTEAPSQWEPAAQADVPVQFAQGMRPFALQLVPLTQGCAQARLAGFHAKFEVVLQPHVVWPVALSET